MAITIKFKRWIEAIKIFLFPSKFLAEKSPKIRRIFKKVRTVSEQITPNFSNSELKCKCGCGVYFFEYSAVFNLQMIRNQLCALYDKNVRIIITSACRCLNSHIQTYKNRYGDKWEKYITWESGHLIENKNRIPQKACAIDFYSPDLSLQDLYAGVEQSNHDKKINGLGIYPDANKKILHTDWISNTYRRWVRRKGVYYYLF